MSRTVMALLGLGLYLVCLGGNVHAADEKPGAKATTVTLTGTYNWGKKAKQPLKGVFTPDGENKWKVVWTFKHKNKPHTYTGTVEGNLQNGPIKGESVNEGGKRKWKFEGAAKNGVIDCNHVELKGKREKKTGQFSIKKT